MEQVEKVKRPRKFRAFFQSYCPEGNKVFGEVSAVIGSVGDCDCNFGACVGADSDWNLARTSHRPVRSGRHERADIGSQSYGANVFGEHQREWKLRNWRAAAGPVHNNGEGALIRRLYATGPRHHDCSTSEIRYSARHSGGAGKSRRSGRQFLSPGESIQ